MGTKKGIGTAGVLVIVLVLAVLGGFIKLQGFSVSNTGAPTNVATGTNQYISTASAGTVYAVVRNPMLVGTQFSAATVGAVGNDGRLYGSATMTGGATKSYVAVSSALPLATGSTSGKVYVLPSSTYPINSVTGDYDLKGAPTAYVDLVATNATDLDLVLYGSTGASNLSVEASTTTTETTGYAMTTGDVRTFYIDLKAGNSSMQFGSDFGGAIVVFTYNNSNVFNANSLALNGGGLTPITCPSSLIQYDSAKACWQMPALKTSDGIRRISGVLSATLGNPGTGDGPTIYFEDVQYFTDGAGVAAGTYNGAGTNVGIPKQTVQLTLS